MVFAFTILNIVNIFTFVNPKNNFLAEGAGLEFIFQIFF